MSNKLKKKNRTTQAKTQQDSVFKEAWDNMNNDMAKVVPGFLLRRLQKKDGRLWMVVLITLIELIILGAVGKLIYDWLIG